MLDSPLPFSLDNPCVPCMITLSHTQDGIHEGITMTANKKAPKTIEPAVLMGFAREAAAYRANPQTGVWTDINARLKKVCSRHGQNFSTVWGDVHRMMYEVMNGTA